MSVVSRGEVVLLSHHRAPPSDAGASLMEAPKPELELKGWLQKRGDKGIVKGWKRRWFLFLHGKLYYYDSDSSGAASLGFIDIESAAEIVITSSSTGEPHTHTMSKCCSVFMTCPVAAASFMFEIRTGSRTYVLRAAALTELRYWVEGLNAWRAFKAQNPLMAEQERLRDRVSKLQQKVIHQSVLLSSNSETEEDVQVLRRYVAELRGLLDKSEQNNAQLVDAITHKDTELKRAQERLQVAEEELRVARDDLTAQTVDMYVPLLQCAFVSVFAYSSLTTLVCQCATGVDIDQE